MTINRGLIYIFSFFLLQHVYGQEKFMDYQSSPREYVLAGISIDGVVHLDHEMIIQKSELVRGERLMIPSEKISKAISNLWEQDLFSSVEIIKEKTQGNNLFLRIKLKERERMSRYSFSGISKSEADQLRDDLDLYSGKIISEALLINIKNISRNYFVEKGYLRAKSSISTINDTLINNSRTVKISINKGERLKINKINISGNNALPTEKIKRLMKETKERHYFQKY